MDSRTQAKMEARARIMKALAHPSRLFIVEALAQKEHCVAELTEMVGADMSTISKHLSILRGVGLIADRKSGTQVFYRLAAPCALDFFTCLESILQANVQTQIMLVK